MIFDGAPDATGRPCLWQALMLGASQPACGADGFVQFRLKETDRCACYAILDKTQFAEFAGCGTRDSDTQRLDMELVQEALESLFSCLIGVTTV